MKKIKICMAAVLVMSLLVLTACGRSDNNNQSSTQSTTSAGSGGNETSGTSGTFKLLGNACPCPTYNLPSINGTAPAAPTA